MILSAADLCTTFQERAAWTQRHIRRSKMHRLALLEETITEINLAMIADKHEEHVFTRQFSRKEEGSKSGADWLWCIGGPGAWLCMLVQAKLVSPKTGSCSNLDYRTGEQRATLVKFARTHRFLPIYCIYSDIYEGFDPLARKRSEFSQVDQRQWSCSLLTPKQVKALARKNQRSQEQLLADAVPWMYPFCYAARETVQPLARGLAAGLAHARREMTFLSRVPAVPDSVWISESPQQIEPRTPIEPKTRVPSEEPARAGKPRIHWEDPDPEALVTEKLPSVVLRYLMESRATSVPISGITVISTVPVAPVILDMAALPAPQMDELRGLLSQPFPLDAQVLPRDAGRR